MIPPREPDSNRLSVFVSFSGQGGVERIMLKLTEGFVSQGIPVDLLAISRGNDDLLGIIDPRVNLIILKSKHTNLVLPELCRYLRRVRPMALLAAKDRAIRIAAIARRSTGARTRLVGRLGTNLKASLEVKSALTRWFRCVPMKWFYRYVDHIVAVSDGVAKDTMSITGISPSKISVIRNPVVSNRLTVESRKPANHPWLDKKGPPVILGAGRLTRQKDFHTLIRAFSDVQCKIDCRLIILGDGSLQRELQSLASELNIEERISFPGHVQNIYSYIASSTLFVLSSAWEGSPNVLTEALALGKPVVSTDCPSGPREILVDGYYGPLIPVGNAEALAEAILQTLAQPHPPSFLKEAVREYTVERSVNRYLEVLGFNT